MWRWQKNKERLLRLLSLLFLKHTGAKNITKPNRVNLLAWGGGGFVLGYDLMWDSRAGQLAIIYFPNSTMSAGNQTQAQISGANLSNIETICHNVTHSSTEVWVWPVLGNIWTCRILECIQENWGWRAANPAWHGGLSCEGGVSSPWTLLIIADKSQTSLILLYFLSLPVTWWACYGL